MHALSFAETQEVRAAFAPLAEWTGLPIVPDRLDGRRLVRGEGTATLLKVESTMVGPDGALGEFRCYTPSLRRFLIHSEGQGAAYRASQNTIGVMVNPTSLRPSGFAQECFRYLLARETGETFAAEWLDEPVLWPQRLTHPDDLADAREAVADLRMGETIVRAERLFGGSLLARCVPGTPWHALDWREQDGRSVDLAASQSTSLGRLRTWRRFLDGFLTHPVPFARDADGRRADGETTGQITPAPILLVGIERTGRASWADSQRAETFLPDPGEWERVLASLGEVSGKDLARGGLAPRTVRAMRSGRTPTKRNAERARQIVKRKARAAAGLEPAPESRCIAPGCDEILAGRRRSFCAVHARFPGTRRKQWKEAR
jgi:hypothetical protein